MDVEIALVGEPEQAHQLARVADEHVGVGDREAPAIDGEALFLQRLRRRLPA